MKIDGRKITDEILKNLKNKIDELKKQNITPHLAIVLVGDDPASQAYVRQKEIKAKEIGGIVSIYHFPQTAPEKEILSLLNDLNHLTSIHGIIVQRPLPKQIDEELISNAVTSEKDIDGFHSKSKFPMPLACAVSKILEENSSKSTSCQGRTLAEWLKTKSIVVIGKGRTGGGPIIEMFRKMSIDPQVIDSRTMNPKLITKFADIIISAVGKSNIIRPAMVKKGVILISVGLHKENDGKLHGDYEEEKIKNLASFYTPTPGGVGPVNVACLLENLILAAKQ